MTFPGFHDPYEPCMVVSFIAGGNRSTRRKPQTCFKSLTNFITALVVIGLIAQVVVNPTTI